MRTEYRKVTVEQEVYIADDGTEFLDEDKCQDYEFEKLRKTFECYDHEYNDADVDTAMFVNLPTEAIVKNFHEVCGVYGTVSDGVDKPGLYIYTEYQGGCWFNMDEAIMRIREKEKRNDQT